jgi:hypothetical protein
MIEFDANEPFPLLASASYAEEKLHARCVDAWLGLRIEEVEAGLEKKLDQEIWLEKGPDIFLTPYTEIRRMFELLQLESNSTVVDLGAAYGRMGFVLARHFPQAKFLGFELVKERVAEGNRALKCFGAKNCELFHADLTKMEPPVADIYFIYDYGTRIAIAKTVEDLKQIAKNRKITLVGRGRATRDEIERRQPWLTVVQPEHHEKFSFYRSQ